MVVGGGQGCNNSRVGFVVVAFLLVVLVLLAQSAIRRLVDRPHHVVFAPVKGDFAHFLCLLFAVLGWHFWCGARVGETKTLKLFHF